jgi:hypothetical protein
MYVQLEKCVIFHKVVIVANIIITVYGKSFEPVIALFIACTSVEAFMKSFRYVHLAFLNHVIMLRHITQLS